MYNLSPAIPRLLWICWYKTAECFLFASLPSCPIDERTALAAGSLVPPKLISINYPT